MGRSKNRKALRRKQKQQYLNTPVPPPTHQVKNWEGLRKFGTRGWLLIGGLAVILGVLANYYGVITGCQTARQNARSRKEHFKDDNFDSGTLKPPPVNYDSIPCRECKTEPVKDSQKIASETLGTPPPIKGVLIYDSVKDLLRIRIGSSIVGEPMSLMQYGLPLERLANVCGPTGVTIRVENNRIYVAASFYSILNEENIGTMDYSHWRLYLPNLLDYNYDDERLEVKDKANNVVFALQYLGSGQISLGGYFLDNQKVIIFMNDSIQNSFPPCYTRSDPNWKSKALDKIRLIKPIFNK